MDRIRHVLVTPPGSWEVTAPAEWESPKHYPRWKFDFLNESYLQAGDQPENAMDADRQVYHVIATRDDGMRRLAQSKTSFQDAQAVVMEMIEVIERRDGE